MPISRTGTPRSSSGPDGYGHGSSLSRSSSQKSAYEERSVDPVGEVQSTHKACLKDANEKESETIGFIPGSADPTSGTQSCGPCASPGGCRAFVCTVLTCGLYRVCQRTLLAPCLAPDQSSQEEVEKISLKAAKPGYDQEEEEEVEGGGWLEDLHIAGVKVESRREEEQPNGVTVTPSQAAPRRASPPPSFYESMRYEEWGDDGGEDVDSLITKKLLELYSEYQIEEWAKCTSDSVFLRKTNEIHQLINDLAEEHQLDEQEAECRIVRGIIRISTRKSKKRRPPCARNQRTLSDSGNETMRDSDSFSFSNNNDYNVQISEETHSDIYARKMRRSCGAPTSGSPTEHSSGQTETDSSGVPFLCTSVRT